MHEETAYEFSFLGKYLNSVAATLADIDESIGRDVDAVERGRELLFDPEADLISSRTAA